MVKNGGKVAVGVFLRCPTKPLRAAIHFEFAAKMRNDAWSRNRRDTEQL